MKTHKLAGLEVSAMGLGCMGMSVAYGDRDDAGSIETIHRAVERGVTFIDTADMYGFGHNEELVGKALKGRREQVVLVTKFGNIRTAEGKSGVRGDPEYVLEACEKSLQRLGTDFIDLYFVHRIDPTVPIEDTVGALKTLIEQGKVRHIGLSEASPVTIRKAHATHPLTAVQTEYSLWTRDVEEAVLPCCRDLGIGFVAYSPLGRGFLTATIPSRDALGEDDWRRSHPRFADENIEKNRRLVDAITDIARGHEASPAQVALAWVLSRGEDIVPIPGTKKPKWLDENIEAMELKLSRAALERLEEAFPPGVTAGDRYPAAAMKSLGL